MTDVVSSIPFLLLSLQLGARCSFPSCVHLKSASALPLRPLSPSPSCLIRVSRDLPSHLYLSASLTTYLFMATSPVVFPPVSVNLSLYLSFSFCLGKRNLRPW